jgi:seryl-tRNA synthetase
MLLIQDIREQYDALAARLGKRNLDAKPLFDALLKLDDSRKATQKQLDDMLAEGNQLAKEIGGLMKSGQKAEAEALRARTAAIKESAKELQNKLASLEATIQEQLVAVPNAPSELVPVGRSADDNLEVKVVGQRPTLHEGARPHWELCEQYNIINFELGVKITGAGFPVYINKGARLQRALINYFLDYNTRAGFIEYQPPYFVNEASGFGTGQLPDKEGQMYHMQVDNLFAIPTAEVPVTNLFRDVILDGDKLPIKCTAYTPCFRREAGSYGKDVRGLNRLHQFDKVEIVALTRPEDSYEMLDEMVAHVAGLLESLELEFRILRLCGGDMGFTSALTYDFEVWSAAQKRWLEVSSVSNFESFQANRLKCRYRPGQDKPKLVHTLNGSAMALPRIMAALLENFQEADAIRLPKVLVPYTGFEKITP